MFLTYDSPKNGNIKIKKCIDSDVWISDLVFKVRLENERKENGMQIGEYPSKKKPHMKFQGLDPQNNLVTIDHS